MEIVSVQSTMYPHLKEQRQMTIRLLQAQKKRYCSSSIFQSHLLQKNLLRELQWKLYRSDRSSQRFHLITHKAGFEAGIAGKSFKFMILVRSRRYVCGQGLQYANVVFFSRFQGFQGMQPRPIVRRGHEDFRVENHQLDIVLLGYRVEHL